MEEGKMYRYGKTCAVISLNVANVFNTALWPAIDEAMRENEVPPSKGISYLGVRLKANRQFTAHIEEAARKAEAAVVNVVRLMPNTGGPPICKRMLLTVAVSGLLYTALT